ncbi:hydroxymethylglutaryl-CoA lyase [Aquabacterium sp. CECT 9606]|jgi:hydroxymethylglutaryl-CoA lyase|uniref:hydroxymethylglutaryl-CoA lyase n=1 Tax=Aquabacterium sp. CECT 9606 TaxID=2845822 RepID=UPI001E3FB3BB|nr:hydroxymethylglutaryl-CoA lyase [Aquabacterium sp. CECT 9606]CAH0348421.1 3-hydroxy-3-isohexenylglutaryl-CoA/hydroxy-methylglutaryl-CoA lyase [Aquabacterium sp. CECT 9606]
MLPQHVTLVEVGPRDGLQNEAQTVSAADKVELVHRLQQAGLTQIEVTSFVSPKWVPQMGDNAEVMAGIQRQAGVRYSVLTPNMKGFEGALAAKADEVVIFAAASEAFSQRNINCSIAESIERFRPVVEAAHANGMKVRSAVSCALGCPYQGEVSLDQVDEVVQRLLGIGADHIGIADTIGVGTAGRVQAVMERALKRVPIDELSGHFHDTYGQALTNIHACLQLGIHTFDSSIAGLGGCPYAKGATGNVATEDVVYLLHGLGISTGLNLDWLVDAGAFISNVLGRKPVSRVSNALLAKRAAQHQAAQTAA